MLAMQAQAESTEQIGPYPTWASIDTSGGGAAELTEAQTPIVLLTGRFVASLNQDRP